MIGNPDKYPVNLIYFSILSFLYAGFLCNPEAINLDLPVAGIVITVFLSLLSRISNILQIDILTIILPLLWVLLARKSWLPLLYILVFLGALNIANYRNYERYHNMSGWLHSPPKNTVHALDEKSKTVSYPQYLLYSSHMFIKNFRTFNTKYENPRIFNYNFSFKILLIVVVTLLTGILKISSQIIKLKQYKHQYLE